MITHTEFKFCPPGRETEGTCHHLFTYYTSLFDEVGGKAGKGSVTQHCSYFLFDKTVSVQCGSKRFGLEIKTATSR